MPTLRFTIQGLSPLLMHNPAAMKGADSKRIERKVIPTAEAEAEVSTYRLPNGDLCMKAVAIRNAIIKATVGMRIGKKAASPYFSGALLPKDLFFPLVDGKGKPLREYEVDVQRAVVQRQGILRGRARIDLPWHLICEFDFVPIITEEHLRQAIAQAGQTVGIGDYRVEKKGWYGRFELTSIEITG